MPADVNLDVNVTKSGKGDEEAAIGIEAVAKAADNAKDQLGQLDRKLLETRAAMIAAGKTFQETGDISPLKALIKDERQLSTVQKSITRGAEAIARDLSNAGDQGGQGFISRFTSRLLLLGGSTIPNSLIPALTSAGTEGGSVFGGGFLSSVGAVFTAGAPVLGPAVAILVADLGAMVSGGLLAGVGLAGIAAGIAAQFNDARVKGAVSNLVAWAKSQLDQATSGFAPAMAAGFNALQREAQPFFAAIRQPLQDLAPIVANLLARLGEGLAKLGPGLGKALEAAGPILERIGADLPMLLGSIGNMFALISEHAKGAGEAIDLLFHLASQAITFIGVSLSGLSSVFNAILQGADAVTGFMAKIPGIGKEWAGVHQYVDGLAHSMDGLGMSADTASGGTDAFTGALGGVAGAATAAAGGLASSRQSVLDWQSGALSADQAAGQWRQGLLGMAESVKQNGTSLQENTTKGEANIQMLQDLVGKARASRDAQIAHGQSVAYADQQYQDQIGTLIDTAVHLHLNKDEVLKYAGAYKQVPGDATTRIVTPGMVEAIQNGQTLASLLHGINGSVARATIISTYYTVQGTTPGGLRGPKVAQRYGGIVAAAQGMIASAPTVLFGERGTGLEAYIPKRGISDQRGLALADAAASWHGGRVVAGAGRYGGAPIAAAGPSRGAPQQLTVRFAGNTDSAFATAFMRLVRQGDIQLG